MSGTWTPVTAAERERMITLYKEGVRIPAIARMVSRPIVTVRDILLRAGVHTPTRRYGLRRGGKTS